MCAHGGPGLTLVVGATGAARGLSRPAGQPATTRSEGLTMSVAANAAACLALTWVAAAETLPAATADAPSAGSLGLGQEAIEPIYEGGLQGHWEDQGWAPRDTERGRPARINFAQLGGWRLANLRLSGQFTGLSLEVLAPAKFGDFLDVRLGASARGEELAFPAVAIVAAEHGGEAKAGNEHTPLVVKLSMQALNPNNWSFDRIEIRARRAVGQEPVEVDKIALWGLAEHNTGRALATSWRPATLQIDCRRPTRAISPLIYGTAYNAQKNAAWQWNTGTSARRWGGNTASRYNWQLGNAWNLASDWFFKNANVTGRADYSWELFLEENRAHGVASTITVPTLGWVAKDTDSYSYPVAFFGRQARTTGPTGDIGNGVAPSGSRITGADPNRTSVPASPAFVGRWVEAIERWHAGHPDAPAPMYILDNEPSLWNSTHRDVHPQAVTYQELLDNTLRFGREVRRAAPKALIAGPAEWGWPSYFYSARDAEAGFQVKPDRRAHGDEPILAWWLDHLAGHEEATGEKLLNVLDVHYYPQSDGTFGDKENIHDLAANQRRVRATRSLWDSTYIDESWIAERIQLLPRLKRLIAQHYPGLELSLGEYNFGGERHISGGVAQAEVLGRLGQAGVFSAYYWTFPPPGSPVEQAFRAYRNYDGRGASFPGRSLPTRMDAKTSLFAARSEDGGRLVAVLVNLDAHEGAHASVEMVGCGAAASRRTFQYAGEPEGLHADPGAPPGTEAGRLTSDLPPWSITVVELNFAGGHGARAAREPGALAP